MLTFNSIYQHMWRISCLNLYIYFHPPTNETQFQLEWLLLIPSTNKWDAIPTWMFTFISINQQIWRNSCLNVYVYLYPPTNETSFQPECLRLFPSTDKCDAISAWKWWEMTNFIKSTTYRHYIGLLVFCKNIDMQARIPLFYRYTSYYL